MKRLFKFLRLFSYDGDILVEEEAWQSYKGGMFFVPIWIFKYVLLPFITGVLIAHFLTLSLQ